MNRVAAGVLACRSSRASRAAEPTPSILNGLFASPSGRQDATLYGRRGRLPPPFMAPNARPKFGGRSFPPTIGAEILSAGASGILPSQPE